MQPSHFQRNRRAFTLIEILIVLAIITLLAAILYPIFDRAQEQALKSSCQSNLKQIGLAVAQYVNDYDETYPAMAGAGSITSPTGTYWFDAIAPYAQKTGKDSIFYCPSAGSGAVRFGGGYGWNAAGTAPHSTTGKACNSGSGPYQHTGNGFGLFSGTTAQEWCTPTKSALRLATVQEPSNTVMVVDPPSNKFRASGLMAAGYVGVGSDPAGSTEAHRLSHMPVLHGGQVGPFGKSSGDNITVPAPGGGGNYLYADGHVKWEEASAMAGSRKWNVDKTVNIGVLRD
jgi:prepilin-type N-terminal cleavage/methylation domain-containing protein/prepilin-type processing-associated H-X9-DG protein